MEEKELSEKEKIEILREVSLKDLEGSLWNYATPKLVTPEQYGQLSKLASADYINTISQTPDQHAYERLFLPQLATEGGAVTSPYLQERSKKILQESVMSVKVEDIYNLVGLKEPMKESYKDKYVFELGEDEVKSIVSSYMGLKVTDIVSGLLGKQKQAVTKGLEEILCEGKTEKKSEEEYELSKAV